MRKIIPIIFFALIICSNVFAQDAETDEKSKCPTLKMILPETSAKKGVEMKFSLEIDGEYDQEKVKIYWQIDRARIVSGIETSAMTAVTDVEGDMSLNVIAFIKGLPDTCKAKVAETLLCSHCGKDNAPIFYYQVEKIPAKELAFWVNGFWAELQKDKTLTGYVIVYGTPKEIEDQIKTIRKDIILGDELSVGYDISRFVFVSGGSKRSFRTRFWLAPPNADFSNIN